MSHCPLAILVLCPLSLSNFSFVSLVPPHPPVRVNLSSSYDHLKASNDNSDSVVWVALIKTYKLLSSLVWIDSGVVVPQHCLESFFIKCNGMTSFMEFMLSENSRKPTHMRSSALYFRAKHEFYATCHSVTYYFMKKDSKRCSDTTTPDSIHTKDESKRGTAFAFIFGVNWPVQLT